MSPATIDASLTDGALDMKDAARAQALARPRGGIAVAWLAASEAYEAAQALAIQAQAAQREA
jgi:hypothetical protein